MSRLDADDNVVSDCSWVFTSNDGRLARARTDIGRAPVSDYSLEKCGFFVQTVDFDSNWEVPAGSADEAWRTIHDGSTATGNGVSPRLVISAPSEQSRTFYVWSDDETKVRIKATAAVPVTTVTMMVDGAPKDFSVGKVTFEGGQSAPAPFLVEALAGSEGGSANLILSAYSNFTYSASTPGMLLVDYITVPVRCIQPLPASIVAECGDTTIIADNLPASIVAECGDTTIIADNDYLTSKTTLSIFLSQPGAADVHVTLKTSFEEDPAKTDWGDYVRFSQSEVTVQTLPEADEITFTIPAGSTEPKTIYVYALRGDSHTTGTGHQIKFTPYISDAEKTAAGIVGETAAGVWISAAKPVITTPDATSVYEVTSGEELEINVAVEDTYADMTDTAAGYQVRVKTGSTASWQTLTERFKASGEGGELIGITTGNPPTVKYSAAGPQTSQIQVISPISGKKSDIVPFTVNVTPAKTTSAICLDADPDHYIEGDAVHFRIALSAQNDTEEPIYAFLLCNGDMDASMFGGTGAKAILTDATAAAPGSVGLTISEVGSFVNGSFTVLDGLSADDAGQNYTFSVVLSKTKEYTGTRMPGYATTEMLNITVYNKEPTFKTVYLNGFDAESDGYTFSNQYPKGQDQTIQPEFDDVSYDLKHGFTYKWTAYRDGQAVANGTVAHDTTKTATETTTTTNASKTVFSTVVPDGANINECPIVYNFPRAGTWMIKVQMKDKDMTSYSASTYSISFVVLANPQITITPLDSYDETDGKAQFDVGLGYFDSDEDIVVKLTVTPPAGTNPGALALDPALKAVPSGYPALAANEYYMTFDSAQTIPVKIDSMDGTARSASKGFTVKAEVVNDGLSPEGTTWAEYYTPHETKIYVNNVAPEFGYVTPANTNAWEVSGGAATSYPIAWSIRSDVDYDFTTPWANGEGPGIKVTFQGCDNATSFYVKDTDEWSGTFIPNFGSMQGDQNVVLTIEDKDQGLETWVYMYKVKPSRFLVTIQNGPSGSADSELSRKYIKMDIRGGRGQGHVYAQGATFSDGELWQQRWNCSSATEIPVYAWGYRTGAYDNGWLDNGRDIALTPSPNGSGTTKAASADVTAGYYAYPDAVKDSFLYAWLISAPQSESAPPEWKISIMPEQPGAEPIPGKAYLPTSTTEDGSYIPVYAEAVFSKEWYPEDNLGDINQDGVPDYFAHAGWGDGGSSLITSTVGGEANDNDLVDIATGNPDGDFIPGVWQAQGALSIVNRALASYAPIGYAFNNRLEFRGFHYGLNETSITKSVVCFSEAETNAYKAAFAEKNGRDWEDTDGFDLGFWSPEPRGTAARMDPTMEDTDSDGMPDGWEYFFWYQAKVWAPGGADLGKPRNGQSFVFEHFNSMDILRGTEIPAGDVLERFNPCEPLKTEVNGFSPDFDGDGLTDMEEMLIGTNPCHWDTDGDHMCDGWEVLNSLDPLNGAKTGNPDGDFMAYQNLMDTFNVVIDDTTHLRVFDIMNEMVYGVDWDYVDNGGLIPVPMTIRDVTLTRALFANDKMSGEIDPVTGEELPYLYGLPNDAPDDLDDLPNVWHWGFPMLTGLYPNRTYTIPANTELNLDPFVLVHDQIKWIYGFDPRTGWNSENGYVAPRWNPMVNSELSPFDTTGAAVNTDPYTDYDEYLVLRYRLDFQNEVYYYDDADGVMHMSYAQVYYPDDAEWKFDDPWGLFNNFATKPNVVYALTDIEAQLNPTNETGVAWGEEASSNLVATANIAEYLAQAFSQAGSTKAVRLGHGADTDGDGVPDGWELYMSRNPNAAPSIKSFEGLAAHAWDKEEVTFGMRDYLGYTAEYAGTDSCNAYRNCESIYRNHPGISSGWFNKFFPTDPDNPDTDGDGILDGLEGQAWFGVWNNGGSSFPINTPSDPGLTFIYGNPEDSITCCVRGGGMNPLTVDTDIDGLPDPWEMQYAGIPVNASTRSYAGPSGANPEISEATFIADGFGTGAGPDVVYICGGMDATWAGDGWTDPIDGGNSTDALLGTRRDVDFDHDGLQNYQEYLVQTMRHFRYDDITTPLMGNYLDEGAYDPSGALASNHVLQKSPAFTPMMQDAGMFANNAAILWADGSVTEVITNTVGRTVTVNEFSGTVITNFEYVVTTNVVAGGGVVANKVYGNGYNYMYSTPWNAAGWKNNGYMTSPSQRWDRMITCTTVQPSILLPPASAYVSTDPRLADTDQDGMDDYYEMFHGLNPILGSTVAGAKDIIAEAWGHPDFYNAFWNEWTHQDFSRVFALMDMPGSQTPALQDETALDPLRYPWGMGASQADPDGDGLRNDTERITANLTSPMTTHTDPSPLWFTDSSSPNSYTYLYYQLTYPVTGMPFWPMLVGFEDVYSPNTPDGGYAGPAFAYPFEENEGYDTDNDWKADGQEIITTTRPGSDPLDFSDPARRQALYLDGAQSWVQSRDSFMRDIFLGRDPNATVVDFFKQFTVEAWIRPEKTGAQTILDRCSLYGYDAMSKKTGVIRSNFRLGLTADGRVYGMFDNDDARDSGDNDTVSCQTVDGPTVPLNEWTHVAMTYDGKALLLYVNGIERGRKPTSLIPANGVSSIMQDPSSTNSFTSIAHETVPGAFFIGGRPKTAADGGNFAFSTATVDYGFMRDDEWYQGYVDEVRIWDGARTASEISANYARKMTKADAAENREEVYTHLMSANADASRNDNDGKLRLTAELVQLYDFSTLPGAVSTADVAKSPMGFDTAVRGQLASAAALDAPFTENVGWWDACLTKSTVYDDYAVVPWIENTVHHLPVMDGSMVDSFVYSDYLGGYYTPASAHGLSKYTLNNSSMPYAFHNYFLERYIRLFCLNQLLLAKPDDTLVQDLVYRYEYEIRSDFIGTADLIPMGGAYAKTCPAMWDGNGVADAWEYSQADADADGLPDWWETKYGLDPASNYDWNSMVDWNGAQLPAYIAYTVDLALGMQPDGAYHPEYASTVDSDRDNVPDWWESMFGVSEYGADADPDKDGLPNYAEYLVSFGPYPYGVTNGWAFVNPLNAYSTSADQRVPDYYLRAPKAFDASGRHVSEKEYFGEIFTDHDFMESWWESASANSYANPHVYDPNSDTDGDGWSNWAENRAATWYGTLLSDTITKYFSDEAVTQNYPQPAIGIRFAYNGIQKVSGKSVVVRTMTRPDGRADARFSVVAPEASEVGIGTCVPGAFIDDTTPLHGLLQPGSIIPTSCYVYGVHLSKDGVYFWGIDQTVGLVSSAGNIIGEKPLTTTEGAAVPCWYCTGTFEQYRSDVRSFGRDLVILDNPALDFDLIGKAISKDDGRKGDIVILSDQTTQQSVFGGIDFMSGEFTLDPAVLDVAGLSPDGMLVKFEYNYAISSEWPQTLWFNQADTGRVKEGLNTIEAWMDFDGNGEYTAGEPYGVVRNVNVGWHKTAETVIELKETSSIAPRYLLSDGSNDRTVVLGASGGVAAATQEGEGQGGQAAQADGLTSKITIRRVGINGQRAFGAKVVPSRLLVSRSYVLDDRSYLTEADVLTDDKLDLDWKWLVSDAARLGLEQSDISSAEYEIDRVITLGDGSVTNIPLATFSNVFGRQRSMPVPRAPLAEMPVYSASPTFSWSSSDASMAAFRIQVSTSENAADVVYDSGTRQLPGRERLTGGVIGYSFTAPVYIGAPVSTNGAPVFLDGTNYFWRVAEFNAKFNSADEKAWSAWTPFQMDAANQNRHPNLPTGYGKCGAVVRYFGPNTNDLDGIVVVEAHRSADFSDQPLAQLRADVSQLDDIDDVTTVNAAFAGVEPGTVYLMAYIDANNNGRRDVSESWGYAHYIATDRLSIFTPQGVTVTDELYLTGEPPKAAIFIEDTDINRNEMPDCLEAGSAGDAATAADTDGDGLADDEEAGFATDPYVWDTDGDGMPDGWEVKFAYLDPNFADSDEVADGDVMAYAVTNLTVITVWDGADADSATNRYIVLDSSAKVKVGDDASAIADLYDVYDYGGTYGLGMPAAAAGRVYAVEEDADVALVHAQVYDFFGFDPTTAVPPYVSEDGSNVVYGVNTKPFTALDKYLVARYLEKAYGLADEEAMNLNRGWADCTLKPIELDGNRDGIADGWELYVMFGPDGATASLGEAKISPFAEIGGVKAYDYVRDAANTPDGGGLGIVYEYDGGQTPSDPWQAATAELGLGGLTDYDAWKFHLKTGESQLADEDNDGLSNWAEYLADRDGTFGPFDVTKNFTVADLFDYFRMNGATGADRRYAGFEFSDHDFVEDYFEDEQGVDLANRYVYDANTDYDGDGWSLWSDARAAAAWRPEIVTNTYDNGFDTLTWVYTNETAFAGVPAPKVNLVLAGDIGDKRYSYEQVENAGETNAVTNVVWATYPVTLRAYRGYNLSEAYRTFYVNGEVKGGMLVATIDGDGLEEGLNTFVVENGDAVGFCTANVGFDRVDLEMTLDSSGSVVPARQVYGYGGAIVIRRKAINGRDCTLRPVWSGSVATYLTAADVLKSGVIDLDARYLVADAAAMGIAQKDIRTVTYEVLNRNSSYVSSYSGATYASYDSFTKTFAGGRPAATPVAPAAGSAFTVRTRKPVFTFTGLDGATAFALQVSTSEDEAGIFLTATNRLSAAMLSGSESNRVYMSEWQIGDGLDLEDNKTYYWRVIGLNAKWPNVELGADESAPWASFQTAVDSTFADTGYGKIAAEVRYYGAAVNDTSNVIVGVWRDAAFAGTPVATKRLAAGDFADLAVLKDESEFFEPTANVEFDGIAPGDYYVMAFNDVNGNGRRDAYETWGYQNKVGTDEFDIYTPVALTVVSTKAATPTALVFMEDTDANDNGVPDCIEPWDEMQPVVAGDDWDRDGLDDSDEFWNEDLWGSDPYVWDTDGDGLPDGYEVWAGLDPINTYDSGRTRTYEDASGEEYTYSVPISAADDAADGDVMAYAITNFTVITVWDGVDPLSATNKYVVMDSSTKISVGDDASAIAGLRVVYDYGGTNGLGRAAAAAGRVYEIEEEAPVALVHAQVYEFFGFDPTTANPAAVEKGETDEDEIVYGANTKPFTGLDKYLVVRYLEALGFVDSAMGADDTLEDWVNRNRRWGDWTLKPGEADSDRDGVPDGWELYTMFGPGGSESVAAIADAAISPWNYDDARGNAPAAGSQLTLLQEFDHGKTPSDPWQTTTAELGLGGLTDYEAFRFHLKTGESQLADEDNDGLSNWAEYLASRLTGFDFDVADPFSVEPNRLDYFVQFDQDGVTKYVGECIDADGLGLIADHDFMEDLWEDVFADTTKGRYVYDAHEDPDGDGWSNWSEQRALTVPSRSASLSLVRADGSEDHTLEGYPIPTIRAKIADASGDRIDSQIVIKAWQGAYASGEADATWTVSGSGEQSTEHTHFLGLAPNRLVKFNIGPGDIGQHHVMIEFYDPNYYIETINYETNGTVKNIVYTEHNIDTSAWGIFNYKDDPSDTSNGMNTGAVPAGWVNYVNGDIQIDFSEETYRDTDATYVLVAGEQQRVIYHYDLTRAFWRVRWMGRLVEDGAVKAFSLSKADSGHLREGVNTFIAFVDADGDGAYTPGELMGIARNVNIGFDTIPELAINLQREPADGMRFLVPAQTDGAGLVRVVRTAINGVGTEPRAVYSRRVDLSEGRAFTEADLVKNGEYDFDWRRLVPDAAAFAGISAEDIRTVDYAVYVGNNPTNALTTFTRSFSDTAVAPVPIVPSADHNAVVACARPSFSWKATEGYSAFALQIAKDEGFSDIVYATTNFMPAATADGCEFSPECWVGDALEDKTTYYWRVAQMNAKFTTGKWSEPAAFTTAVDSTNADTGYGKLTAEVRYFGPADATLDDVVVGVYESADFASAPVARRRLGGADAVSTLVGDAAKPFFDVTANVAFDGIAPGHYYVMAFIDSNANGVRDPYETWGYACRIGADTVDRWSPVSFSVSTTKTDAPAALVVMEDTDVNQNWTPDCLEDMTGWNPSVDGSGDSDRDGLTDLEEDDYGTDPNVWDTDGDGMPDGWEVKFANIDPLFDDADDAAPGDVMAYAVTNLAVITVWDGVDPLSATNKYVVMGEFLDDLNMARVNVGDDASALTDLFATYDYGGTYGLGLPATAADLAGMKVYAVEEDAKVALVHDQVYEFFGFDPTTAIPPYVSEDGSNTVYGVNTKPFTALDKYLLVRYLAALGLCDEDDVNFNRRWAEFSLKPFDADNDRDGAADGWELYIGADPWNYDDRLADGDGDGLPMYREYDTGLEPSDPNDDMSIYRRLFEKGYLLVGTPEFTDGDVRRFRIRESEYGSDDDNDLITNLEEMQAYYYDLAALADIDPEKAWSDGATPDYFRSIADFGYLGLLFNGGEFIEPSVRRAMGIASFERAGTRDYRDSGWDAWSTARYSIINAEQTINIDGVVSDELMLLIRYWNVIRPGEFTGTTVGDAVAFFHEVWNGVVRLLDDEGNILIEAKDASVSGPGTIHDANAAQTTTQVVAFFGGQAKMEEVIARNKKDLTADEIVTPEPTVDLTLKYDGNESHDNFILEAYQTSSAYPEYGEQLAARWSPPIKFNGGVAQLKQMIAPGLGSLMQGPARFVAYIDDDGDGKLSAGDTYGSATCEVGYLGCDIVIRLGDANDALPVISLVDTMSEAGAGADGAAAAAGRPVQTVAIVRTKVNGEYVEPRGVALRRYLNNVNRTALYPTDFVADDFIGVDRYLAKDSVEGLDPDPANLENVEEVTYEIVKVALDPEYGFVIGKTNLNHYVYVPEGTDEGGDETGGDGYTVDQQVNEEFTVRYSVTRDVPLEVKGEASSKESDALVSFLVPVDRAVTKFWLDVDDKVFGGSSDRGFPLANLVTKEVLNSSSGALGTYASRRVILDKDWFRENGVDFSVGEHKVRVALGNDKFPTVPEEDGEWSAEAVFGVAEDDVFEGKIDVVVNHPTAALDEKLTIAAYEKADLANPVVVTNGCPSGEVVEIGGLRPGVDYYIAAWYVKDEEDGRGTANRRMPYDTWGYLCNLSVTNAEQFARSMAFDPVSVAASDLPRAGVTTNMVWLQDTDWNDNGIVDRQETIKSLLGVIESTTTESRTTMTTIPSSTIPATRWTATSWRTPRSRCSWSRSELPTPRRTGSRMWCAIPSTRFPPSGTPATQWSSRAARPRATSRVSTRRTCMDAGRRRRLALACPSILPRAWCMRANGGT